MCSLSWTMGLPGCEKPIDEQAVHEIIQNIVQRGDGKVWIDDWKGRFATLANTPKDFMESRPDLFNLNHHGRGYSVELVGEGEQMAQEMSTDPGLGQLQTSKGGFGKGGFGKGGFSAPKGGVDIAGALGLNGPGGKWGAKGKGGKSGMMALTGKGTYGVIVPGTKGHAGDESPFEPTYGPAFKGGAKSHGKGGKSKSLIVPEHHCDSDDPAEQAIEEIKAQMARRREPKVWIEDWRDRYSMLGPSPKHFMESRPDVFKLHYEGSRYTVEVVDGTLDLEASPRDDNQWRGKGGHKGGGKIAPAREPSWAPSIGGSSESQLSEEAAVEEISQLVAQSPDGRIWVADWQRRFSHLARNPKEFMEARPDVFALTYRGNSYLVALAGQEAPEPAPMPMPMPRKRPIGATGVIGERPPERPRPGKTARLPKPQGSIAAAAEPPAEDESSAMDMLLGDKEEDALVEIFDQLSKPSNSGKIVFPNWTRRFGHLAGSARAFIEMHSDKFEVIPGPGGSYTVDLI